MKGDGEEVEGSNFKVLLRQASVPTGGEEFVDEEEWVGADFEAPGGWAEAGIKASARKGGLWSFWAYKNGTGTLVTYKESPYTTEQPVGEFVNLALIAAGNHLWCLKYGPYDETQYSCMNTGFTYSPELQDGSEMATNTKPEVAGSAESDYESLQGQLRNWNKATDESNSYKKETVNGICVWRIAGLYPGDINDGTC
jgi:hypothetical protein